MYNRALLDELPDTPVQGWHLFSPNKMGQALQACSALSAPSPDHIMWKVLKEIIGFEPDNLVTHLADACVRTGCWPNYFKESNSVIIPKPSKPLYSTPKAFHPIVLLNTLGKLIEKMIAN